MLPTVHVTVDSKCGIAAVVHADDPDLVLIVPASHIIAFHIRKAEHQGEFVFLPVIGPQIPVLDKRNHRPLCICLIGHFRLGESQHDPVLVHDLQIPVEHFVHGPVIIQKVHFSSAAPDPEKFPDIVGFRLFPVSHGGNLVLCQQRRVDRVAFLDTPLHLRGHLRRQVSPADVEQVGMDIDRLQGGIVRGLIRFQIPGDLVVLVPGKCCFMEILCKIHTFLHRQFVLPLDPCIIKNLLLLVRADPQRNPQHRFLDSLRQGIPKLQRDLIL